MVNIIISRANINRQPSFMQKIKNNLENSGKVFVVVPEQLSLQREFSIGSEYFGRVSVFGFNRLSNEIFRAFGGTAKKTPDDVMIASAVYKAVKNCYNSLVFYKSVAFHSGFISKLISVFSEFEINKMTKKAVLSIAESDMNDSVRRKYTDLFTIYDEYKRIWHGDYKVPETDISSASELLELNDFFSDSSVIFDGFYGFTGAQLLMLEQILSQAKECSFYFTTDMKSELFCTIDSEIDKIMRLCKKLGLQITFDTLTEPEHINKPSLSYLEKYAFEDYQKNIPCFENDGALTVYSAKNLSEELSYVACKIKNDVLSGKYRYRDIAVLSPNIDGIATIAEAVFEKHGIPVYIDVKRTLLSKPLMAFVLGAFEIVIGGFEFENIFSFLKTGLTGIEFDDISMLENYVRMWKIKTKGWIKGDWTQSPSGIFANEDKAEKDAQRLLKLNKLRERIIEPLNVFSGAVRIADNTTDMLKAVYRLLENFNVKENLEKIANEFYQSGDYKLYDEYTRVYDILIDMLGSVNSIVGTDKMTVSDMCDMLTVCAGAVKVSHRPSRVDEVVVTGLSLVREENIRCVYIPCMNEGYIPKPFSDSSIITESDKRMFIKNNLPVSMDFVTKSLRERFDLYAAISSASDEVVLSMSEFETTGEVKSPSEYLNAITELTDVEITTRQDLKDEFFLVSVSSASELASTQGMSQIAEAIFELTGFCPTFDNNNPDKLSDEIVRSIYSNHLHLSFSGIEEYVSCPFKFFLHRGLRISKDDAVEFNAANMGTFIHAGLERLLDGENDVKNFTDAQLKACIDEISEDYYQNDLKDCKNRSKRFDYLFSRAKYALQSAAENVVREIKSSDFEPFDFEIDISEYVKQTELSKDFTLSLVGSIDRVDMANVSEDRYVKVIDYKSGKQTFSLDKIYNGLSMQLPIYASAVRSKHGDVKFAAMYYLKVGVPEIEHKKLSPLSDLEYLKKIDSYYTRDGLFDENPNVLDILDKDGVFLEKVSKTSIVPEENINKLVDFTTSKVGEIGTDISSGKIDISPICDKKFDSCEYCDYKNICRIDDYPERKRELSKMPENFFEKEADEI